MDTVGAMTTSQPSSASAIRPVVSRPPAAPRDYCLAPNRPADAPAVAQGGRYARLFPELPRLPSDERQLHLLGSPGGACDGAACARADAEPYTARDATISAGWPFFGQFVAHDVTADRSPPAHRADADRLRNARALALDLECLYGAGPAAEPYLYDVDDGATLLLGTIDGAGAPDVPRNAQGVAVIADPRNDSHALMTALHVAFARLHNGVVRRLADDGVGTAELFDAARRVTLRHYHWVIVNDFLPTLVGGALVDEILADGPRYYRVSRDTLFIPVEFADAAYRYGHGQIRDDYRLRVDATPCPLFPDLLGFRPLTAERVVDWRLFFDGVADAPNGTAQRAKRMDGTLPRALLRLPRAITGEVDDESYHSLAARDLQRGHALALPSGETLARHMGVTPLTPDEVGLAAHGWEGETPLWFYVLREADVRGAGDRLGPVGGRIVAETLLGVLRTDPEFYLSVDAAWRPTLPSRTAGTFTIGDLLTFATTV
jgi:hypothetical protein